MILVTVRQRRLGNATGEQLRSSSELGMCYASLTRFFGQKRNLSAN
jgi:hypothetical protein